MQFFLEKLKNIVLYISKKSKVKCSGFVAFSRSTQCEGKNYIGGGSNVEYSELGYASYIGNNCTLKKVKIGRFCSIADNVCCVAGNHPLDSFVSTHPAFYSTHNATGVSFVDCDKFVEYRYVDNDSKYYIEMEMMFGSEVMS